MISRAVLACGALGGCEARAGDAADMERALRDSSTALVGALVGLELLAHMFDMPQALRHSPNSQCGAACPCVLQVGLSLPVQLTLDYATGCVPDSGLLPAAVTGRATVDFDGRTCDRATFADLELALVHPVSGQFGGRVFGGPGDQLVHPTGDLRIGDTDVALELAVDLGDDVRIDGTARISPSPAGEPPRDLIFDAVVLPWNAIGTPCPRPISGTATLAAADPEPAAVVRYAQPGDGLVTVVSGRRVSEPVDYCAYSSTLW